jgi:hypothetical protein
MTLSALLSFVYRNNGSPIVPSLRGPLEWLQGDSLRYGSSTEGQDLDAGLCRVGGLNLDYTSGSGTPYHIQVEDRGPVTDRLTGRPVRRVNVVVHANYREPNAGIIHGCDHDYPDIRTREHNAFIARELHEQAAGAKSLIEERERRKIDRLKRRIRAYHASRSDEIKREFEQTNALYPFVFARAWQELRRERAQPPAAVPGTGRGVFSGVGYPADADLREHVVEIERIIIGIGQDMARVRTGRGPDESLLRSCGETVAQARAVLSGEGRQGLDPRRLFLVRNSLLTAWRRVHARL